MKSVSFIFVLLSSFSALAGDGGFDLWTCVSNSGRTNLTIYADNLSDAKVPMKVVFGIDGQFMTYEHYRYDIERPENEVCQDDCTNISFENQNITINNGDFINMSIELKNNTATIAKGFVDPRPEYQGAEVGAITLSCKQYNQAP